jgi:hypothetical protein
MGKGVRAEMNDSYAQQIVHALEKIAVELNKISINVDKITRKT